MTLTIPTAARPTARIKSADVVVSQPGVRATGRYGYRQRRARRAVLAFAAAVVLANLGLSLGMDYLFPQVRDPEYGRRLNRLRARVAEHPGRPLVLALGSSRVAMGLRPAAADDPAGPLVFNFAEVGAGPVMQVMTLRRLLADGATPDAVLLEFWPPFLRQDGPYAEAVRIDPHRLLPTDRGFVRDYLPHPDHTEALMREFRRVPVWDHRLRLVNQLCPGWLPHDKRLDAAWEKLGPLGWLPGRDDPTPELRAALHAHAALYYQPLFTGFRVDPIADRATRELLATCRDRGVRAAFVWLPESTEFRGWYPPAVLRQADEYLAAVQAEFGVPLIDAREWVPDPHLADGFHLSKSGADVFSARLAAELRKVVR